MVEPLVPVWFTSIVTASLLVLVFVVIYKVAADEFRYWKREQRKEELRKRMLQSPTTLILPQETTRE